MLEISACKSFQIYLHLYGYLTGYSEPFQTYIPGELGMVLCNCMLRFLNIGTCVAWVTLTNDQLCIFPNFDGSECHICTCILSPVEIMPSQSTVLYSSVQLLDLLGITMNLPGKDFMTVLIFPLSSLSLYLFGLSVCCTS